MSSLAATSTNGVLFLIVLAIIGSGIQASADCSGGKEILVDAKEEHSGFITSLGYPDKIISSFCKYKIQASKSSRVYVEFTHFDLPVCKDGFIELLSRKEDEDETEVCLGKQDKVTNVCEFCNKAKPVPSHSKANDVTLVIKFNVNSTQHKGFRMEWRAGQYGNFYNWVEDPVNNRTELYIGIVFGVLGLLVLIIAPLLLYRYRRRLGQGPRERVLLKQIEEDGNEDTL